MSYLDALLYILPEVVLTVGLCAVLTWDMFTREQERAMTATLTLGTLGVVLVLLLQRLSWNPETVFGMVHVDRFGTLFKIFMTTAVGVVVAYDLTDRRREPEGKGETYFLLLTAALGSFFLVGSNHLILIVLGLETLGLSSYALSGMYKRDRAGAEASLKYVVYGALASGMMLYGISLLYGMTGTFDLVGMVRPMALAVEEGRMIQIALPTLLILVGFGFKLSAFPFQWWAPDVYQGVSTPVATFLAVGSKGVAVAAFLRVLATGFGGVLPREGQPVMEAEFAASLGGTIALISAITMVFGNLAAVRQTNLKRLLAYSSIAHAGYILVGVALMSERGFEAATLYTFVYYFMNLGAFGAVIYFANQTGSEEVDSLRGMGFRHPVIGTAVVVFLASLTGLPPTAGFAGKWYLMAAAWEGGLGWLALLTGIMSVVSLFYYFRIAKALFLQEPATGPVVVRTPVLGGILGVLAVASVWFIDFEGLLNVARDGVQVLFRP